MEFTNGLFGILFLLLVFILLISALVLSIERHDTSQAIPSLLGLVFVCCFAYFFGRTLLWWVAGYERVRITENFLSVERRAMGLNLKRKRSFPLSELEALSLEKPATVNKSKRFRLLPLNDMAGDFGESLGRIGFIHAGEYHRFATGVTGEDAKKVFDAIVDLNVLDSTQYAK